MNAVLETFEQHRSVRSYRADPVDDQLLEQVIRAGWRAPSSINGQQVSLVVVRDAERRQQIARIAGGQPWIAVAPVFIAIVMDFHKTALGVARAGKQQVIHESLEGLLVGAVDAGIVLGNLMAAAESLGLGVVPIGGIRRDLPAMIELLQLPARTLPVVGLVVGHPADPGHVKPRMSLSGFCHQEVYQPAAVQDAIERYDQDLVAYWQATGRTGGRTWSEGVADFYSQVYAPDVPAAAVSQGFLNDK